MDKNKKSFINSFALSLSLLTRFPIKSDPDRSSDWSFAPAFFPICGTICSVISSIPFILLAIFAKGQTRELVCVFSAIGYSIVGTWFTRALHLDGLSDSIDAFSAMQCDKEHRLKIMKDPHPGSSAVVGLILHIFLKTAAAYLIIKGLSYLSTSKMIQVTLTILSASMASSRLSMTFLAWTGQYPRTSGTAMVVVGKTSFTAVTTATIFTIIACLLCSETVQGIIVVTSFTTLAIILNTIFWLRASKKLIGGVTGDILGACAESTEASLLIIYSLILNML